MRSNVSARAALADKAKCSRADKDRVPARAAGARPQANRAKGIEPEPPAAVEGKRPELSGELRPLP
jgi:hypothetical protein